MSTKLESLFLDSSPDFGSMQCTVQKVGESEVNYWQLVRLCGIQLQNYFLGHSNPNRS